MGKMTIMKFLIWGLFLESPDNFQGPKSCFVFAGFAFKIKGSIILRMAVRNCQLTNQSRPVCELGTTLLFKWF